MNVLDRLAERHNLQRVITVAVAVMLVTLTMSSVAAVTAFKANSRSNQVATEQADQAKALSDLAIAQNKFLRDTFCGLVFPLAHTDQPPVGAFGQRLYDGSIVANRNLSCVDSPSTTSTIPPSMSESVKP